MIKLFRTIKLYFQYRENIKINEEFLFTKYGLERNGIYELFTTIVLSDAPDEMKQQYGSALADHEIKKYINNFNNDLPKMDLEELVNIYEIKKINEDLYGITFGYSLMSNKRMIALLIGGVLAIPALITLGIIVLI